MAQDVFQPEFITSRPNDRVLVIRPGGGSPTNTVAIASDKGIVVIDTGMSRSLASIIRKKIEQEFNRNDFIYLINTHHHNDHIFGNQVYSDIPIIAHDLCPVRMREEMSSPEKVIEWCDGVIARLEKQTSTMEKDSADYQRLVNLVGYYNIIKRDQQSGFTPTYPNVTFNDRLNLDLGDLKISIFHFPGLHSDDDILIYLHEDKILISGDAVIGEDWMPMLFGPQNLEHLFRAWEDILKSGVDQIIVGHPGNEVSPETFRMRYKYFTELYEKIKSAKKNGLSLEEAKSALSLESEFPYMKDVKIKSNSSWPSFHEHSIEVLWNEPAND